MSIKNNNILILGNGLLGGELHRQTGWPIISRCKDGFDITQKNNWRRILDTNKIDTLVNCIGHTKTHSVKKTTHWNVNYKGVVDLSNFCDEFDIKLVHISTDFIYYHSVTEATEADVPANAPNWYSYTKMLSDAYVQLKLKNYLLIRCSHKKNPFPFKEGYINYVGNFDYVETICQLIVRLIESNASDVYNVGTELKTMYDLAIKTNPNTNAVIGKIVNANNYINASMDINKMITFFEENP